MPDKRQMGSADPVEAAEAWFLHHGLPWFVDEIRDEVAERMSRARVVTEVAIAVVLGLAVGALVGLLAGEVSIGISSGVSTAALWLVLYTVRALHSAVIAGWALRRTLRSLGLLVPLATRALPMLLLFITFLFINTEVWQVASALRGGVLWSAILFFAAAAVGFLVPRLAQELDDFDDQITTDDLITATQGTPLEAPARQLIADSEVDLPEEAQVTGLQMVNLVVVLVIAQAVQVFLLAVAVFVFFMVFGSVAIDDSVIESWVGAGHPRYLPGPDVFSIELIRVSTFLAGFSGLYFTVTAITDETYRREFFTTIMKELQRAVGARVIYRELRRASGSADAGGASDRRVETRSDEQNGPPPDR